MACYKFYQDKKCTVWERTFFTVEADSEEAAIRCAGQLGKGDLYAAEMQQEGIAINESETLYDTMNEISTEENSGNSIIEIRLDNGDDLDTNVAGPVWVIGGKKPAMNCWNPLPAYGRKMPFSFTYLAII